MRTVLDMKPTSDNLRNGEGVFFRSVNGEILYAYSRFRGNKKEDDTFCDIAMIRSKDEGESWSDYQIIASAEEFGVENMMCASALPTLDGRLCVYFLVKENDGSTTIGRTISSDGVTFKAERCECNIPKNYYVIENDRFIRLSDGRIATVASSYNPSAFVGSVIGIVSDNDGAEFHCVNTNGTCSLPYSSFGSGLEEPIIIELAPNLIWLLCRTNHGYQFQAFSTNGMWSFTPPEPSVFTSPGSPIVLKRLSDNSILAAYNPIPNYNGRSQLADDMAMKTIYSGRTPLVLRRSKDNGVTWGDLYPIEVGAKKDFCYPCLFETKDGGLLCAYMCYEEKEEEIEELPDTTILDHYNISMRIKKLDFIPD